MSLIPPIAHFIWLGSSLPDTAQRNIEHFRKLHPAWEVRVWNQYPDNLPEGLMNLMRKIESPKSRAALLRLWVLYIYGGVYMDHDVQSLQSLDPLLQHDVMFVATKLVNAVLPCVVGAYPRHRLVARLINMAGDVLEKDYGDPEAFGRKLFARLRREHPWEIIFLPEVMFCAFKLPLNAVQFLSKDDDQRAEALASMWRRIESPSDVYGVHTFGLPLMPLPPAPEPKDDPAVEVAHKPATFLDKLRNATTAAGRAGKKLLKGEKVLVTPEEQQSRLAICGGCEFLRKGNCRLCGCVTKFKTRLTTEHCPINKW